MVIRGQLRDDATGDARWIEVDNDGRVLVRTADGATLLTATGPLQTTATDSAGSPYAPAAGDSVVLVDATAGPVTVALPAASAATGRVLHIKRTDGTANTVTVDPDGTETIDGSTTATITAQWENLTVASTGTEWVIL